MDATIGARLARHRGFGPGFDFLRVTLAIGVVLSHSWQCMFNDTSNMGPFWLVRYSILPMFFALSGFLITGSAMRLSLKDFLINRGARIVPALLVELLLSACILGPLMTSLSLADYLTDRKFYTYFFNILGYIHYELPGVFITNPFSGVVNGSLWTIPHEIACYALMSVIMIFGVLRSIKRLVVASSLFFLTIFALAIYCRLNLAAEGSAVMTAMISSTTRLIIYFVCGILCYMYRDKIPYNQIIFTSCLVVYVVMMFIGNKGWADSSILFRILSAPIFVYMVIFIGATSVPKLPLYSRGDYSYGIYLYGFPLQQTLLHIYGRQLSLAIYAALSIVASTAFAIFSWHVIEKPSLKLRKSFTATMRNRKSAQPSGVPISETTVFRHQAGDA